MPLDLNTPLDQAIALLVTYSFARQQRPFYKKTPFDSSRETLCDQALTTLHEYKIAPKGTINIDSLKRLLARLINVKFYNYNWLGKKNISYGFVKNNIAKYNEYTMISNEFAQSNLSLCNDPEIQRSAPLFKLAVATKHNTSLHFETILEAVQFCLMSVIIHDSQDDEHTKQEKIQELKKMPDELKKIIKRARAPLREAIGLRGEIVVLQNEIPTSKELYRSWAMEYNKKAAPPSPK